VEEIRISGKVKKNLLDLEYNKNVQFFTTAIIILFTYFIGVFIAVLTKQIDYRNPGQLLLLGFIFIAVIAICILSMLNFKYRLKEIIQEILKLEL